MEDEYIDWLKSRTLEESKNNKAREDWIIAAGYDVFTKGKSEFDVYNVIESMKLIKEEIKAMQCFFGRCLKETLSFQIKRKENKVVKVELTEEGKSNGKKLYDDFCDDKKKEYSKTNYIEVGNVYGQVEVFKKLIEEQYQKTLYEQKAKDERRLVIDFSDLAKFDPTLANLLLEQPEEIIKAAEISLEQIGIDEFRGFKIRFKNLPLTQKIRISEIRSKDLGKFVVIDGVVRQKSDVRPQVTAAKFECPSCGNMINVLQIDTSFKEPSACGCGRKGRFRLVSKELIDCQIINIEEPSETLDTSDQPKQINVFLKDDLVSPLNEKKYEVGSKVSVNGLITEVPIHTRAGTKSTRFDLIVEANYVQPSQFEDMIITPEEEKEIIKFAHRKDIFQVIKDNLAPSIYGHELIKEGLALQLLGGVRKEKEDGTSIRGDIHVLLLGDPSTAKSQLIKRISVVAPKARFTSGTGSSGVGSTASVVKNEILGGYSLKAGAMVLANNGFLCYEEMDKAHEEVLDHLHTGMEQQVIHINKGDINATLTTRTSILASANPKHGRFDVYEAISSQINLKPTLINRFDLIYIIKDLPDKEKDEKLAEFILDMHKGVKTTNLIPNLFLRKYFYYARKNCKPKLTNEATEEIKYFYTNLRNKQNDDSPVKTIPINPRQLDGLVRLSEANAKMRLSDKVTKEDAQKAVQIVRSCLMSVGYDAETGKIDIDRIESGVTASQRSKIVIVKEIINKLEETNGKTIPMEDIVKEGIAKGLTEETIEELIDKMKHAGDLFEPRKGFIHKI